MADDKKEKKKKSKKKEEAPAAPEPASSSPAPAPAPAPAPVSKGSTKKAARSGSNVFSMFTQRQVQEFKEAFQLIDQDKDGFISKNDLKATFDSLGRVITDEEVETMVSEAPGPINFTMFLTIFGDKMTGGTDEEDVIVNAFIRFDEGEGLVHEDTLRHALMTWGEKLSSQEVDDAFNEAPMNNEGQIDLKKFAQVLTRGAEEEEEAGA
ncbi:LOW QUALITY PROTEIN: myosin regulatory light chain 2-like [Tachypleus tridentatus]|uniref:LOW QUALITY PROTEIN: myosin regulatory light chain 2-like n=1 Tax=Tachypleus tridentatus TaxID=6853 RepID=UPI003FD58CF6